MPQWRPYSSKYNSYMLEVGKLYIEVGQFWNWGNDDHWYVRVPRLGIMGFKEDLLQAVTAEEAMLEAECWLERELEDILRELRLVEELRED